MCFFKQIDNEKFIENKDYDLLRKRLIELLINFKYTLNLKQKIMKKTIKILILIGLITCTSTKTFSQISVSYYSSSLSKIGFGYNFSNKLWTELRIYSNTPFYDVSPELVLCYNILNKEKFNVYAGIGGVVNYFNGVSVPVGVQFTPFDKLDKFSLHIELQPTIIFNTSSILQTSWGVRYKF